MSDDQNNDGGNQPSDGQGGGKNSDRSNRNRKRKGNRNRRRNNRKGGNRRKRNKRSGDAGFWGDMERLPQAGRLSRITDDPAAVARSLDTPPLPGHEQSASYYFEVVYNRAVQTASALAVAGGLLDPEALLSESEDD